MLQYDYVPKDKEDNLNHYKYAAEDHSILYNHFFGPIATFQVEKFTPEWIAPNLLTLGGFLCIILPYILIWTYSPWDLHVIVPNWVYLATCAFHFLYFHLDNMDGKQARKTGNASALGLIFDHGCDAISVYMQAVTIMSCLYVPNGIWQVIVLFTPSITFFISNLEELYTHKMYLPMINPAVEGVVITGVVILFSGIVGQEYMSSEIVLPLVSQFLGYNLTIGQTIMISVTLMALVGLPMIFGRIYAKVGFLKTLESIKKCWFMIYSHAIVCYFALNSEIANFTYRYAVLMLGFNMCKQLTLMLVSSASKSYYNSFPPINFVIMTAFFVNTYRACNGLSHFDEFTTLFTLLIISFFVYVHLIKNIADQFCRVLKIKCFSVKEKTKGQ